MSSHTRLLVIAGVVTLLTLGAIVAGLAMSWSSITRFERVADVDVASERAALTLVFTFKKQVQEWKNVLLRGGDPESFEHYWGSFLEQERHIQHQGRALLKRLTDPEARRLVEGFLSAHEEMGVVYRRGLRAFKDAGFASEAGDQVVKGIDRAATKRLEAAAAEIAARTKSAMKETTTQARRGIVTSLIVIATALVVWTAVLIALERMRRLQAVREGRARIRAVVDTAADAIITITEDGTMESFNRAAERLFGYSAAEAIGRNVSMLMPEPYHSDHDRYLRHYLETGESKIIGRGREVEGQQKDGNPFPIHIAISEVLLADRRIFTGIVHDLTDRKRAEKERERLIAELEARNAELERFAYTVSHGLKSPLITIGGFLGLLEKDAAGGDTERLQGDIAQIRAASGTMQLLLDELLALSRIGRLVNPPQTVSLGELAREAVDLVAGRIAERRVQVDIAPDLPVVVGDRPRLVEVFQNLIENAVKFMGAQSAPRVEVGARQTGEETLCYVRDNGVGIDPRYHEKVFGLFERLDAETEGTGLGLALVKRIIEVHGGCVWVESEGEGRGCTFYFTIPQKRESANRDH